MISNIFSHAFYRESMRRIKGGKWFLILYLALTSLISATTPWACELMGIENEIITYSLIDSGSTGFIVCIFAPFLTLSVFSFVNKRSDSDYYESLPVTHKAMAFSGMLAVFFVIAFSVALSILIYVVCSLKYIGTVVFINFKGLLLEFLVICLAAMIGISISAIASAITGTGLAAYLTTAILLFTPSGIMSEFNSTVSALDENLISSKIIPIFNSSSNLYSAALYGNADVSDPIPFITSGVIAILCGTLATVLFDRRKSEFATRSFASVAYARAIALIVAFSIAAADISLSIRYGTVVTDAVINAFGAVIFYIAFVAIANRKTRSFGTSLLFVPLIFVFSLVFIGSAYAANGILSSDCKREEMRGVYFVSDNPVGEYYYLLYDYEVGKGYNEFIADKVSEIRYDSEEMLDLVYSQLDNSVSYDNSEIESQYYVCVPVSIEMNYRSVYRYVYFDEQAYKELNTLLAKKDEFCALYSNPLCNSVYSYTESFYTHYGDDSREIEQALISEIESKGAEKFYNSLLGYSSDAFIYAVIDDGYKYQRVYIDIGKDMSETVNIINSKDKIKADEFLSQLSERINNTESFDDYIWINIYSNDKMLEGTSAYAYYGDVTEEFYDLLMLVDNSDFDSKTFAYISLDSDTDYISGFLRIRSDVDKETLISIIEKIYKIGEGEE